ncbi:MAG: SpoIIE family protein phosphatase [Bacteroidia bacterium]|nr:SpoIIE family protein phosphatase [Bacteroidia bacterium]
MSISSTIDYFVNPKDKLDPEKYRKGRFFIISFAIFFVFALVGQFYVMFGNVKYDTGLIIGNAIFCVMLLCMFFIYKKWNQRILLVNISALMGYTSNFQTYEISGGIYSSDLVNGIVICAWLFLVANRWTGIFWFTITYLTITFLYVAEVMGWHDFKGDLMKTESHYPYLNFGFCCFFLAVVINMYENYKNQFLKELKTSKSELEVKSKELEVKNRDVTDSINYAKRIQYAVLPQEETIYRSIPLSFIFYKPKDIVSGDFFWFHEINKEEYLLVCADCTGHGVPGAFMTVIGSSLLNQTVIDNKIYKPSDILQELDKLINFTLKQQKDHDVSVQDGMDLTLIKVNKTKKEVMITSAKRPVIFIRNKELTEIKASKFSLGGMRTGDKIFKEEVINYQEDDLLYLFTDGYADQFGGEKAKKFSSKRLRELFLDIHRLPMTEQKQKMAKTTADWQGELEQIDDMLVIGIKL